MRKNGGVVCKLQEKVKSCGGKEFWGIHCIIHQEVLCSKSLKMDRVMSVVTKKVYFINLRGLNRRQFHALRRILAMDYPTTWMCKG